MDITVLFFAINQVFIREIAALNKSNNVKQGFSSNKISWFNQGILVCHLGSQPLNRSKYTRTITGKIILASQLNIMLH